MQVHTVGGKIPEDFVPLKSVNHKKGDCLQDVSLRGDRLC